MQSYFQKTNFLSESERNYSPSGKYSVQICTYKTKEGCWNYSQGIVRIGDTVLQTINRNYPSFNYCWGEGHPNGHDYFVCGEHYQYQTIIELDTNKKISSNEVKYDLKSYPYADFCWANYVLSEDKTKIGVSGCFWAAPYECVVFDFSNPMNVPYRVVNEPFYFGMNEYLVSLKENEVITKSVDQVRLADNKTDDEITDDKLNEAGNLKNMDKQAYNALLCSAIEYGEKEANTIRTRVYSVDFQGNKQLIEESFEA